MSIKQDEAIMRSKVYLIAKLLIKVSPAKTTMTTCFEAVAEEFSYESYRAVSNIYHTLKKEDSDRLDNMKPSKS